MALTPRKRWRLGRGISLRPPNVDEGRDPKVCHTYMLVDGESLHIYLSHSDVDKREGELQARILDLKSKLGDKEKSLKDQSREIVALKKELGELKKVGSACMEELRKEAIKARSMTKSETKHRKKVLVKAEVEVQCLEEEVGVQKVRAEDVEARIEDLELEVSHLRVGA